MCVCVEKIDICTVREKQKESKSSTNRNNYKHAYAYTFAPSYMFVSMRLYACMSTYMHASAYVRVRARAHLLPRRNSNTPIVFLLNALRCRSIGFVSPICELEFRSKLFSRLCIRPRVSVAIFNPSSVTVTRASILRVISNEETSPAGAEDGGSCCWCMQCPFKILNLSCKGQRTLVLATFWLAFHSYFSSFF